MRTRRVPERKTSSSRLVIDLIVPVHGAHTEDLKARIVVVEITMYERSHHRDPWTIVGRKYICGTPDAFYLRGFDFPFKLFEVKVYSTLSNPYAAANAYVVTMANAVHRLVPQASSLKYVALKKRVALKPA